MALLYIETFHAAAKPQRYRGSQCCGSLGNREGARGRGVLTLRVGVPIWKLQSPLFDNGQPLVLPSSNLQPSLFMKANDSPFKLSLIAEIQCLFDLILANNLF